MHDTYRYVSTCVESTKVTKTRRLFRGKAGKSFWRGRLSTVDLLVLTSLDQILILLEILFTFFYKTSYPTEEINCTQPAPSVSIPLVQIHLHVIQLWHHFLFSKTHRFNYKSGSDIGRVNETQFCGKLR